MTKSNPLNFYLGIVAPLGVDSDIFFSALIERAANYGITLSTFKEGKKIIIRCKISEIIKINDMKCKTPESLKIYAKMQIFNELRSNKHRKTLGQSIIELVRKTEKEISNFKNEINIIIIDQIKNVFEYELLSYLYRDNYTQIGLFSKPNKRNKYLETKFRNESTSQIDKKDLLDALKMHTTINLGSAKKVNQYIKVQKISEIANGYLKSIRNDCSSALIMKDFEDTDKTYDKTGQSVSKIYHRSHFYFDLDKPTTELNEQVDKFLEILLGKYKDYPTQSEFAMSVATQSSVRSNFPHRRHVGSAIISPHGELISSGSIRSPSGSPNTSLKDEDKIRQGYQKYKDDITDWESFLDKLNLKHLKSSGSAAKKSLKIDSILNLKKFISSSLDFHPCTHAEISSILDAAKMGASIRCSTLYATTYPCHLCAKDIITAGIKEVVYLEAYPKSKNDQLYPHNITDHEESDNTKIRFVPFFGVGPERFYFYYSLENKPEDCDQIEKWRLRYSNNKSIKAREKEVIDYAKNGKSQNQPLASLLSHKGKSNK